MNENKGDVFDKVIEKEGVSNFNELLNKYAKNTPIKGVVETDEGKLSPYCPDPDATSEEVEEFLRKMKEKSITDQC